MIDVKMASANDFTKVKETLAEAFSEDPLMSWLIPGNGLDKKERIEKAFAFYLKSHDLRFITGDYKGILIASSPGKKASVFEVCQSIPMMLRVVGVRNFFKALKLARLASKSKPKGKHYYLMGLAVDPKIRGRGHALALVKQILKRCDSDGVPAYLEAATPKHVRAYARFGFKPLKEVILEPSAPVLTPMIRQPQIIH